MRWIRALPLVGRLGLGGLAAFVVVAFAANVIAPHSVVAISGDPLSPPSWRHPLGTNRYGQDIVSQLIVGTRAPLQVAAIAGVLGMLIAGTIGMTAGWLGGRVDSIFMVVTDFLLVLPRLPLLLLLGFYVGGDLVALGVIVALLAWPFPARVLRSQVLSLRRQDHLRAAVGFGAGNSHVLRAHIAPELGLVLIEGLIRVATVAVFLQAGLAFLGIGPQGVISWGAMIDSATGFTSLFYSRAWAWWLVPPVVTIVLLVLSLTFVGVGLEQAFNPRVARHPPRVGRER